MKSDKKIKLIFTVYWYIDCLQNLWNGILNAQGGSQEKEVRYLINNSSTSLVRVGYGMIENQRDA